MNDEILRRYIDKIAEIDAAKKEGRITESELFEIAKQVGLSDDDVANVDEHAKDAASRAEGFMEHRLWDRAVESWEDATALAPFNTTYSTQLATCLLERGYEDDSNRALTLAHSVLELDVGSDEAYEVIARADGAVLSYKFDRRVRDYATFQSGLSAFVAVFAILGAIVTQDIFVTINAVFVGGLAAFIILSNLLLFQKTRRKNSNPVPRLSNRSSASGPKEVQKLASDPDDEIPIRFELPDGFEIIHHQKPTNLERWYGTVVNNSGLDIECLQGTVLSARKSGERVRSSTTVMRDVGDFFHRPGDEWTFWIGAVYTVDIVVTLKIVGKRRPAVEYPPATEVPFDGDFTLKRRNETFGDAFYLSNDSATLWQKVELSVEHIVDGIVVDSKLLDFGCVGPRTVARTMAYGLSDWGECVYRLVDAEEA